MWLDKLRDMKEQSGLTTKEIAARSKIPEPTLEKLFAGATKDPKLNTMQQLVHFFGYTLDDLDDTPRTNKTAPSDISEEARKIARSYDKMTPHGKGAVQAILNYEEKELSHFSQHEDHGKVITLPKSRKSRSGMMEINVYDQPAAAGLGNYLDEPEYRVEQYPADVIPDGTDFGVLIDGDSMEPRIHNGGTVFVHAQVAIDPGKIGVFVLDGKVYCKQLTVDHENRQIRLVSLNKAYDDILVGEFASFRTLGHVIGQWTPGRRNDDIFGW